MVRSKRMVNDAQLLRDVARTLRERRDLAALTPEVLGTLGAIEPADVSRAVRYWESANRDHPARLLLRAGRYDAA